MALTAKVDETANPPTLTVTSDKRAVTVTVLGETATAFFGVKVTDTARKWTLVSDDGATAVYKAG